MGGAVYAVSVNAIHALRLGTYTVLTPAGDRVKIRAYSRFDAETTALLEHGPEARVVGGPRDENCGCERGPEDWRKKLPGTIRDEHGREFHGDEQA